LILWLSLPRYQGSGLLYNKCIFPLLNQYEPSLDQSITAATDHLNRKVSGELERVSDEYVVVEKVRVFISSITPLFSALWSQISSSSSIDMSRSGDYVGVQDNFDHPRGGSGGIISTQYTTANARRKAFFRENPQHNVSQELLLSEETISGDQETYVSDFIEMLRKGLYVFAAINRDPNELIDISSRKRDKFELRIFAIDSIGLVVAKVGCADDDEVSTRVQFANIMYFEAINEQGIRISYVMGGVREQRKIIDMVLSDEGDRDTLLHGLKLSLPVLQKKS